MNFSARNSIFSSGMLPSSAKHLRRTRCVVLANGWQFHWRCRKCLQIHLQRTLTIMAKTFLLHHAFPEDGCMLQRDAMESRVVGFLQEVCFILCCRIVWEVGTSFRKRLINRYRINVLGRGTINSECRQEHWKSSQGFVVSQSPNGGWKMAEVSAIPTSRCGGTFTETE